uniref:P450 n=1 Tax=Corythucha ciliata TaxID=369451 RepID=A0A1Z1JNE6_CORCT|nr:P450 [Corythucha ciliata]
MWTDILLAGCVVLLIIIYKSIVYLPPKRTYELMKKLPGPRGLPLIGMGLDLVSVPQEDLFDFLHKLSLLPGRVTAMWVAGVPVVMLWEPEDLEVLLKSKENIKKGNEYRFFRIWLNNGLLVSSGEKWHKRRKLLTPSFHFRILESSAECMNRNARLFVEHIAGMKGEPFDIHNLVNCCTLDILCEAAMGVSLHTMNGENPGYVEAICSFGSATVQRVKNPLYRTDWMFRLFPLGKKIDEHMKYLHGLSEKIIAERKCKKSTYYDGSKQAFLDSLIELQSEDANFTDADIKEEVHTFLTGGQHTLASALGFSIYMFGLHPEIQEVAYKEQRDIFGYSSRDVTAEELPKMKYLEKVIKETLRLFPSVPYMSRKLSQDVILKDETIIPQGANLVMIPFLIHRNPQAFPDPEVFNPERFTSDKSAERHPFSYIPFSAGPKNCIGQKYAMMELKIVLSTLLRSMKIVSLTDRSTLKYIPSIVLEPSKPLIIKFIQRH